MVKVVHYAVEMAPQEVHVADGLLVNSASYVGKQLKTDTHVPGRLWADDHADFYHDVLGAYMETVAIICHGYVIPFDEPPPVTGIVPNNKSCDMNPEFVLQEMVIYTKLGCIQEVDGPSMVMLPLSLVFSNKTRLVVDASCHLNPYVSKQSTKLNSLDELGEMVKPGMFFSVEDLDSGYWHLALHPDSYHYCRIPASTWRLGRGTTSSGNCSSRPPPLLSLCLPGSPTPSRST